jgi:nucleoid DNA-binding protein
MQQQNKGIFRLFSKILILLILITYNVTSKIRRHKLKKSELIQLVRENTGLRADVVTSVLAALEKITVTKLSNNEEMLLMGVGTLSVKTLETRVGRNPKTGEKIQIPQSKRPQFRPTTLLKKAINSHPV